MFRNSMFTLLLLLGFIPGIAQTQVKTNAFNLSNGLGIEGYDPVAYFTQSKAVEGKKEFTVTYNGAKYYCSSSSNKALFQKNPEAYIPQYGGWCAYAMGKTGEKVEVDPETFKIKNGKLYLFYNAFFNNTLTSWNKDEPNLSKNADINWKKFQN